MELNFTSKIRVWLVAPKKGGYINPWGPHDSGIITLNFRKGNQDTLCTVYVANIVQVFSNTLFCLMLMTTS